MNRAIDSPMIKRAKEGSAQQTPIGVFALEKRKNPRYAVEFPLDYSLVNGETIHNAGLTADVSEGGLLVYLPERIETGVALKIEIFYTKGFSLETIVATAKAVWSHLATKEDFREHRYGLQFQSIDEWNFNKLQTLLREVANA